MAEPDFVTRDQHRADLVELRLELANTLASLDKRTELIAQDLGSLRREVEHTRGDLHQEMQGIRSDVRDLRQTMERFQQTTTRQMWTMISVVTAAVLAGVVKLVLLP